MICTEALMIMLTLTLMSEVTIVEGGYCSGVSACEMGHWMDDGSCSRVCGGGVRKRWRKRCCCCGFEMGSTSCWGGCSGNHEDHETITCNTECYHGYYLGGCHCHQGFHGYCCEYACTPIQDCKTVACSSRFDQVCKQCNDQGHSKEFSLFWPSSNNRSCVETCAWKWNWCWPGHCGDHLPSSCVCGLGFKKNVTGYCDLDTKPDLLTCRVGISDDLNNFVNSTSTKDCSQTVGGFMNFNVFKTFFVFESFLNVTLPEFPIHINESQFGVVRTQIVLTVKHLNGRNTTLKNEFFESCNNVVFNDTKPVIGKPVSCSKNLVLKETAINDGERICLKLISFAGGYMVRQDFHKKISEPDVFKHQSKEHEVCFTKDITAPNHCKQTNKCKLEPLWIDKKITKHPKITIGFDGWYDPEPISGNVSLASGIETYKVTVHEVVQKDLTSLVMKEESLKEIILNSSQIDANISVEIDNNVGLYAVSLTVLDKVENFQKARRFFIYDNVSKIDVIPSQKLWFNTSFHRSKWQIHHGKTCLLWKGRYYNTKQKDYNLLRPIQADVNSSYHGIFEQLEGILNISGTPNINGLVSGKLRWKINDNNYSKPEIITTYFTESLCSNFNLQDGDILHLEIENIDIMGNTYKENTSVNVDRSIPEISGLGLYKEGHHMLFAHSSTNMAEMVIKFKAFDIHSGIRSVEWQLGSNIDQNDVGFGSLPVAGNMTQCDDQLCYCPKIGSCEFYNYTVDLTSLRINNTQNGIHNKAYFFTLIIQNNAGLRSAERIDILLDDSPPVIGVVFEGKKDENDVDFSSFTKFPVHWSGFVDHESGIAFYRVGIHQTCLNKSQMIIAQLDNKTIETKDTETLLEVNMPGKYFVSVIALNYALEPSNVACSDGIMIDVSAPLLLSVKIKDARNRRVLTCVDNKTVLVSDDTSIISLNEGNFSCACNYKSLLDFAHILPLENKTLGRSFSEQACKNIPIINEKWHIYLPSDKIAMTWTLHEPESQIDGVYIGYASGKSHSNQPDLKDFHIARSNQIYVKQHTGISTGIPFFIVIKVTNKATLSSINSIGPIIIDESSPVCNGNLKAEVINDKVFVSWMNKTFLEPQQVEDFTAVQFQIKQEDSIVSPLLEAELKTNCPLGFEVCFSYPIFKIQHRDTAEGSNFSVNVHIINIAGHFVSVESSKFMLPSRLPPGHGHVYDIDKNQDNNMDVDYFFIPDEICVRWSGFKHHRNVSFEVGLGNNTDTDNILKFRPTTETHFMCLNKLPLEYFKKYYFLVQATCSGGQTISVSDGFSIINKTYIQQNVKIQLEKNQSYFMHIILNETNDQLDTNITLKNTPSFPSISIRVYCTNEGILTIKDGNKTNRFIKEQNLDINIDNFHLNNHFIHLKYEQTSKFKDLCNFSIVQKLADIFYVHEQNRLDFFVEEDNFIQSYATQYEIALNYNEENVLTPVLPFSPFPVKNQISVFDLHLKQNSKYELVLRVCFEHLCVNATTLSFCIFPIQSPLEIENATIVRKQNHTYQIKFGFEPIKICSEEPYIYTWSICQKQGEECLTKTILSDGNNATNIIQINLENFNIKTLHGLSTLCVQSYFKNLSSVESCTDVKVTSDFETLKEKVLFELDYYSLDMELMHGLSSQNIGKTYLDYLSTREIDFIGHHSRLVAYVLGSTEQDLTCFLSMSREQTGNKCDESDGCIEQVSGADSLCVFNTHNLKKNTKYFICAKAEQTDIERRGFLKTLSSFKVCGNGFYIDVESPTGGYVIIHTDNPGYVNSLSSIHVSWDGFSDIEQHVDLPNGANGISEFSLSLGTQAFGTDILPFTSAGKNKKLLVKGFSVESGSLLYATVKAKDMLGLERKVSSRAVVVDVTPPTKGWVSVMGLTNNRYLSTSHMSIHWGNIEDYESGIADIHIGIGSSPTSADIMPMFSTNGAPVFLKQHNLRSGHVYFIVLMVTNNAGLRTFVSSSKFKVDLSPPSGGYIFDGFSNTQDNDFQLNTTTLQGHWKGFHDSESGMAFYEVGIGTAPLKTDISNMKSVGLQKSNMWQSLFTPGVKYYITLKACNNAGMCTVSSSNGIIMDKSPPIPGVVFIGSSDKQHNYWSNNKSIAVFWVGFQDPQSHIKYFEWCLGTGMNKCDIAVFENVLLASSVLKNIQLKENVDMYATVKATNWVGLSIWTSSAKFVIDTSPPEVIQKPRFFSKLTTFKNHWENTVVEVNWKFSDNESSIAYHILSLTSHKNGKVVQEEFTCGSETQMTFVLEDRDFLQNGDEYTMSVTACNAADLCSTSFSDSLLIDSSPPSMGGFTKDMAWEMKMLNGTSVSKLFVKWFGFEDLESRIISYDISASCSYSGSELYQGVINNADDNTSTTLYLTGQIPCKNELILSLLATNAAGLKSQEAKTTVSLVSSTLTNDHGQIVELQRHSCKHHYCNGDCTCAVIGQKCTGVNDTCVNQTINKPILQIFFGSPIKNTILNVTSSKRCLQFYWMWVTNHTLNALRFEWSLAEDGEKPGEGIFDILTESVWKDNGLHTEKVHCIENENYFLKSGKKYIAYVRVWSSFDTYIIQSSSPILVDHTAPALQRGSSIKEAITSCDSNDVDFTEKEEILICWDKVFRESDSKIESFTIMGGTNPFGGNALNMINVGLNTSFNLNTKILQPGTKFFFTIMAENSLGMVASASSNGIIVDIDKPLAGETFNSGFWRDVEKISGLMPISFSWKGFIDQQSFVKKYFLQVLDTENATKVFSINLDGTLSSSRLNGLNLTHGRNYKVGVSAIDTIGHQSQMTYSNAFQVDNTPPVLCNCLAWAHLNDTTITNNQFVKQDFEEHTLYKLSFNFINKTDVVGAKVRIGHIKKAIYLQSLHNGLKYGEFIWKQKGKTMKEDISLHLSNENITSQQRILMSLSKCVNRETNGLLYVKQIGLSELSIRPFIEDGESGIVEVLVGVGTSPGGFQLHNLSPWSTIQDSFITVAVHHGTPIYVTAIGKNGVGMRSVFHSKKIIFDLTPPSIHHKSSKIFLRGDAKFENISQINMTAKNNGSVENMNLSIHEINPPKPSLTVVYEVQDAESGIELCQCEIVSPKVARRIVESVDQATCQFENLDIKHGNSMQVDIECINKQQLHTIIRIPEIRASFTPPDVNGSSLYLIPNNEHCEIDNACDKVQTPTDFISFHWDPMHDGSGIDHCEFRLQPNDDWMDVGKRRSIQVPVSNNEIPTRIMAEVRCINAGNFTSPSLKFETILGPVVPTLTGRGAIFTKDGTHQFLSWCEAFNPSPEGFFTFHVVAGTQPGFSNVVKPFMTRACQIPVKVKDGTRELFLVVYGYGNSPDYTVLRQQFEFK